MKKNDSLNDMEKYSTEEHEGGVNASARQVSDLIDPAGGNKTMRMVDIRLLIILGALCKLFFFSFRFPLFSPQNIY
jgi:hypothetical protein